MVDGGTSKQIAKTQLYEVFAEIGKALSSASRLELLELLSQVPRTVEELAEQAHLSLANTSQHLQRLKAAGLVITEREGTYIRYRLADPAVARLWLELRAVAEQRLPGPGAQKSFDRLHRPLRFSSHPPQGSAQSAAVE